MGIKIHCVDCNCIFEITNSEIERIKANGFQPPRRCEKCRSDPYLGLKSNTGKLGYSSQDFSKNPASDSGFMPVGFSSTENRSLKQKTPVLLINGDSFYARFHFFSADEYSIVLVNNEDKATHFDDEEDMSWVEILLQKYYPIEKISYRYTCLFAENGLTHKLRMSKLRMDTYGHFKAVMNYRKCLESNYEKDCTVNSIKPRYDIDT